MKKITLLLVNTLIITHMFGMGALKDFCKKNPTSPLCGQNPVDPEDPPPPPPPPVDQITDPKYCTSFLFDNNETTTHRLLSDKVDNKTRDAFVDRLVKKRYNTISLQLVSNKEPSVQYNHSKMGFWRTELKKMKVDNKLKVVMWLRSDNAPKWSLQQWKDYVAVAIEDLDDLVDVWTTGIENDEYWKESEVKDLVAFMKSKTKKPVGVHTTPTLHHASYASTADMFFLQTGFGVSAAQVRDQLVGARKLFPNKEIMLAEFHKDGTSKEAEELCAQGLATNIPVGCMTGCAGRLGVTPPPPPPPTGCPAGGSKSNLIKPKSDNDGKLVLVLSCQYLNNTSSAKVGSETGRDSTNYTTLPNGARVHFRFSKPGSSYGNQTIRLKLKDGTELCYTDNMGVRKEGWSFKSCGGSNPPPPQGDSFIDLKPNGEMILSQDIASSLIREPKLFYTDGPNEGDNIAFNGVPNEKFVGSGTNWKLPNGTANYKGRHGILFNTKAGAVNVAAVKWPSFIERPSTKPETSNGVDTWGGFLKYEPGANSPSKLYETTGNSITLRQDFQDSVSKVDALVTINETAPGQSTSTVVLAARSGNTWTIPKDLSSYPRGNRVNTYRLRLSKVPPKEVTYHTSIMQTFVRETEIADGKGKTYPPTTRQ